jgi:hypothetical protein
MEIGVIVVVWVEVDTLILNELVLEEGARRGNGVNGEVCEAWGF